jgi:hypothetical protein
MINILRRKAASARFRARLLLGQGALPNALIIGAARCGTTSLFDYLAQHPAAGPSRHKELRFFDRQWRHGPRWYRANFPGAEKPLRFEATPSYLLHPQVPERVRSVLGAPRLIVMLREPVARAYSHWNHRRSLGDEHVPFAEAIECEEERPPRYRYLAYGRYAAQIERWLEFHPRSAFHFIRSEDFYRAPAVELDRLTDWLGLPRHDFGDLRPRNTLPYPAGLDPALREALEHSFAGSNRRLADLTGIGWP